MCIKRRIYLTVAAALLGPLGTVNAANIVNLIATIDGSQAGTGSAGTGAATMTLDLDTDLFTWIVNWQNLSGSATAAHFHGPASAGQNAGVQAGIDETTNPATNSATLSGQQSGDLQAGLWYINIHSAANPGGEIRGQVLLDSDGDGIADVTDPDDDNDFIRDELDTQPLIANNNCTANDGNDATLVSVQVTDERSCASKESVKISGDDGALNTVVFGTTGDLRVISEKIVIEDTKVEAGGRFTAINADPCPGCIFQCPNSLAFVRLGDDIEGEAINDQSGWSIAMSDDGNTVIMGTPFNGDAGNLAGHARVFRFDGAAWTQLGDDIDGEAESDQSGNSVAMSSDGNTVVIGADLNNGGSASGFFKGHARVFHFEAGGWMQVGDDIDGDDNLDQFGYSVAMSSDGNTVAIGATGGDATFGDVGEVRVFRFDGSNWMELGGEIYGDATDDLFGQSVAMSSDGNTVVIGAPNNDDAGTAAGHVQVHRFDTGSWSQLGGNIDGEAAIDFSGDAVAMSGDGNSVVVGAYLNDGTDTNAGHARVYRLDGGNWTQLGTDIDGETAGDWSGRSVAISNDGNTVIIGAPGNADAGYSAGSARVFRLEGANWIQLGMDLDGDVAYDFFGHSVAMSSSGDTVVLGGIGNSATGNGAGRARAYRLQCVTP